jgi:RluA family pseudouridine synthase
MPPPLTLLHADAHLVAVAKPAGLLSQPDATGDAAVPAVAARHVAEAEGRAKPPALRLVHRLDRPTSGVVVLARTAAAARALAAQFRERTAEKRYLALAEGRLTGLGTCRDAIAKRDGTPQLVDAAASDAKPAELTWQALAPADVEGEGAAADEAADGPPASLLLVQLHTGRPHQIRLQLAARGHPVVGDTRYGAAASSALGRTIALHHHLLRVEHPATARVHTFTAPVPAAWSAHLTAAHRAALARLTP